jgi:hypothetical protein
MSRTTGAAQIGSRVNHSSGKRVWQLLPWLTVRPPEDKSRQGRVSMKKKKSKRSFSTRALLMERVLDYINADDFEDYGDFIIFGDPNPLTEKQVVDPVALREFVSDLKRYSGMKESERRVALDGVPAFPKMRGIERLKSDSFPRLCNRFDTEGFQKALFDSVMTPARVEVSAIDSLDARYASEMIGKLHKIVERALAFDPVEINKIPSMPVREYFREAHSCYLLGYRVACAVLCRALLEAAMVERIDPKGLIERDVKRYKRDSLGGHSYFSVLLEKAKNSSARNPPLLKEDRPDWAEKIRNAGNWAIHDIERFNQECPADKLGAIVDNTRKILIDLYS